MQACIAAFDERLSPKDVRTAFEAAAEEAGKLMRLD
ncbi:DUF982 domain-containing protein [Mesorhizobium sp. B2-6-4]|nr:DUF982 domain-containing protein [Mesorhizobium sp. B2-6-4]